MITGGFGGGGTVPIVIDSACVSDCPLASATRTVNDEVPAVVGVPEIAPVVEFKLRPGGSVPDPATMFQVSGGVPPLACTGRL